MNRLHWKSTEVPVDDVETRVYCLPGISRFFFKTYIHNQRPRKPPSYQYKGTFSYSGKKTKIFKNLLQTNQSTQRLEFFLFRTIITVSGGKSQRGEGKREANGRVAMSQHISMYMFAFHIYVLCIFVSCAGLCALTHNPTMLPNHKSNFFYHLFYLK